MNLLKYIAPLALVLTTAATGSAPAQEHSRTILLENIEEMAIPAPRKVDGGYELTQSPHRVFFGLDGPSITPLHTGPNWRWHFEATTVGSAEIASIKALPVTPEVIDEKTVRYDRGNIIEKYIIKTHSLEQQFVLPNRINGAGEDVTITGNIQSDGAFEASERGWLWQTPEGIVSLGTLTVFDAGGQTIPAKIIVTAQTSRIIIDGKALAQARYPVTVDPEIGSDDFRISTTGPDGNADFDASNAAVAYNSVSDEYLVVWSGDNANDQEFEIHGQRIDAETGNLVGSSSFGISDMGPDADVAFGAFRPDVAFSGSSNQYLVVWYGDDDQGTLVDDEFEIYGQLLDASGTPIGGNDFRISDMGPDGNPSFDALNPAVAYNSSKDEFLVVWHADNNGTFQIDDEFEIFGQRLKASDGSALGANDFQISNMGFSSDISFEGKDPDVTFNSTDNQYLVVWRGDDSIPPLVNDEFEIFGQRLDGTLGSSIGNNDFRISDMGPNGNTSFGASSAAVTYDPTSNEYLVVWVGDDDNAPLIDNEFEVFGQRIAGATGAEVGDNDFRISDLGPDGSTDFAATAPDAAYNGSDDEYLVVWHGDDNQAPLENNRFEVFAQRLSGGDGGETGTNDFPLSSLSVSPQQGFGAFQAAVAHNTKDNEFLIVWQGSKDAAPLVDGETEIFGQRFTTKVAPNVFMVTNGNDSGSGSLRQALLDANTVTNASTATPDRIEFDIPSNAPCFNVVTGSFKIKPQSDLPEIDDAVVLDGLTQSGADCNSWPPNLLIEIDGSDVNSGNQAGLVLAGGSGNSTLRGFVINRFQSDGIRIMASDNNLIECNYIGTDVTGTAAAGNFNGIALAGFSTNNQIGGLSPSARNLISGNVSTGITTSEADNNNTIQGNFVGTDVTGSAPLANLENGIYLWNLSSNNLIGGTLSGAGNVISGNGGNGIQMEDFANDNIVEGNLVGTDSSGTLAVANAGNGIKINADAVRNRIGGTSASARNIISTNGGNGILLDFGADSNTVLGNFIGLAQNGNDALGNSLSGIHLMGNPEGNIIGGTDPNAANRIAFNQLDGIRMVEEMVGPDVFVPAGNSVLGNRIFSNGGLAINLDGDASNSIDTVTANDTGDPDGGPNGLLNFPIIDSAILSAGTLTVSGTFNGVSNASGIRLEFFANTVCNGDANGLAQVDPFGEGETFLGNTIVNTDGSGNAPFSSSFGFPIGAGDFITATATSADNTSEFSECTEVTSVQVATVSFSPTDDGQVKLASSENFGSKATAKVEADKFRTYLKFNVTGLFNTVLGARLRLRVGDGTNDGSDVGGIVSQASNDFSNGNTPWNEEALVITNAPDTFGPPLDILGAVTANTFVEFTLGAVVPNDGIYSFCITSNSSDQVKYLMKESISPPELLVDVASTVDNLTPRANDDVLVTQVNVADTVQITANDVDLDGQIDPKTVAVVVQPVNGIVTVDTLGFAAYTPNSNFIGNDSFEYTVKDDDDAVSNQATVSITVTPPNEAPVAVNDNITTQQDSPVNIDILGNDSDSDGTLDASSVAIVTNPANGSVTVNNSTGIVTYTPANSFFGLDPFTYTVQDNLGAQSNVATVVVSVKKGNQLNTLEFIATDDGQVKQTDLVANYGAKTTMKVTAGKFTSYLKFVVTGLVGDIQSVNLRLHVTDGATDGGSAGGSLHQVSNNFSGSGGDWNEDELNFQNAPAITTPPFATLGPVSPDTFVQFDVTNIVTGDGTYSFAISSATSDQVKYFTKEHNTQQPALVVEILGPPGNTDPIAADDDTTAISGQPVDLNVTKNDVDLDGLLDLDALNIVSQPANGSVQITPGTGDVTYTSNGGFSGADTFTYTVGDNEGGTSNAATVTVDVRDNSQWSTLGSGLNDRARALAVDANGNVYAAGDFSEAGGNPASKIAMWDGQTWSALGPGLDANDQPFALAANDTNVYVGGDLTGGLQKWDGSTWSSLGVENVFALTVFDDTLYAGGDFSLAGGVSANNIAKFDGQNWTALDQGVDSGVRALTFFGQELVAGGLFTQAGGLTVNQVARWDGTWHDLNGGVAGPGNPSVDALTAAGSKLYAGGLFTTAGTASANNVAEWNGTAWSPLGTGSNNEVLALAPVVDQLFASAEFLFGVERVAKWDGQLWRPLGTGVNDSALAVVASGRHVYFAGAFTEAGGQTANYIAEWTEPNQTPVAVNDNSATEEGQPVVISVTDNDFDPDGSLDLTSVVVTSPPSNGSTSVNSQTGQVTYTPANGFTGNDSFAYQLDDDEGTPSNTASVTITVSPIDNSPWSALGAGVNIAPRAIAIDGADVYVGGTFTTAGGQSIQKIARWDGSDWNQVGNGAVLPDHATVFGVAVSDSGVFIGGDFTSVDGQNVPYLARFHNNAWSTLGTGVNNRVNAIATQDSNLYAGGVFSTAGGLTVNRIARWDGHSWTPLATGMNSTVLALAVDGNILYAGGLFTTAGGTAVEHIAQWDGATWSPLGAGINNIVTSIAVDGGDVYAVGNFTSAGGTPANRIAMWDGTTWSALGTGLNNDGNAVAARDGQVFVAGRFSQAGATTASLVAKWNGSNWTRLGDGLNNTGWTIATNGTDVFVGGDFTQAGLKPASKIAVWGTPNLAPVAQDDAATTESETPVGIAILTNDFDQDGTLDTSSVSITSPASSGSTSIDTQTGAITYTSNAGFAGQDTFRYTIRDDRGAVSNEATVTVTVQGQQVVQSFSFLPVEDGQVKLTSPSSNYGTKTTAKVEKNKFRSYFKFNVSGLPPVVQSARLRLTVTDDATDASDNGGTVFSVSNNFDGSTAPWGEATLTSGNAPEVSGAGLQTAGAVQPNAVVEFDVTSAVNGNGVVSFALASTSTDRVKYFTREGAGPPKLLVEALTSGSGVAPVAVTDTLETDQNVPGVLNILANDSDPDGVIDVTTVNISLPPVNGTVGINVNSGVATYTPNSNFSGQDEFRYTVKDDQGLLSNEAIVTVIVAGQSGPPPTTLVFGATDDGQVKLNTPGNNYGSKSTAKVERDRFSSYFKFEVSGVTGQVESALLQLTTGDALLDGSIDGGSLFLTSNNFDNSNQLWDEALLTAGNAPAASGNPLSTQETVQPNTKVEFDVTSAISADGIFSFVLTSNSADQVKYYTKEGLVPPKLVIETGMQTTTTSSPLLAETDITLSTEPALPTEFKLGQNYPNPFNAGTTISYALPEDSDVNIRIYNIMGQLVKTLIDANQKAGFKSAKWLGRNNQDIDVSSGIYFVRLEANQHKFVNRVLLQK